MWNAWITQVGEVPGTWINLLVPERSLLLLAALQPWAATRPMGLTIFIYIYLSFYSRFSQMFPHSSFKFPLQLTQSSSPHTWSTVSESPVCQPSLAIGHLKFWDVLCKEPVTLGYSIVFLQKFQNEHWQAADKAVLVALKTQALLRPIPFGYTEGVKKMQIPKAQNNSGKVDG